MAKRKPRRVTEDPTQSEPATLTISQLARRFGLSRSTLLYYDSIGLLSPSGGRSQSNYRLYSASDIERMERINIYRQAGLALADIGRILDNEGGELSDRLEQRLREIQNEIRKLRRQQQMIGRLLTNDDTLSRMGCLDKQSWVGILQASGMSKTEMRRWHIEFERASPEGHRDFLESLGIEADEVQRIRAWAAKGQVTPGPSQG